MNKETYNPYIHEITLSKKIQEERYFIEKRTGIRNKKEIKKEDFEILQIVLNTGKIKEYYTLDHTNRPSEEIHEYQILGNTIPYIYLEEGYKDITENIYRGTLVYYRNKNNAERTIYSDNDE